MSIIKQATLLRRKPHLLLVHNWGLQGMLTPVKMNWILLSRVTPFTVHAYNSVAYLVWPVDMLKSR